MRVRIRRVLAISAIALTTLVVGGVLFLHTNAVQTRILAWSIDELERRFDLKLAADHLHYNLARRRVTLTNVRLAALGHLDQPFFGAGRVTVQLPWAIFRGQLRFDDIEIEEGRVLIYRDANGISNLPSARTQQDPNAPPRRIDARGLHVRSLDFAYRDVQRDIDVLAQRFRSELSYELGEGAKGPFAIGSNLVVRLGKRRVVVEPAKGEAAFDGTNLDLIGVGLTTQEGTIAVNGTINRVLDQPQLDLALKGSADIARAALWAPPPIHIAGTAALDGTMKGPPTEFVLDARVSAPAAEIGQERDVRVEAISRLSPNGIAVSKAVLTPRTGGEVVTSLDVPFGESLPWWVLGNYSGIDAAAAFRMAEVKPLPFGAAIKGTARLDATPGKPLRLEIHNTSFPRAAKGTAPLSGDVEFFIDGDRWRANQKHRIGATHVSGDLGGFWNRQAVRRSTFSGRLDVQTADVGDAARTAALFGFSTPAIVRDSQGLMAANVEVTGQFDSPRFVGSARSDGVVVPSLGKAAFAAAFDVSARAVNITNIDATLGTAHVKGDYLADLVTRRLAGSFVIDAPSASDLLTMLPESLRLEGPLSATAALGGTVDTPDIATSVAGKGMTLGGQPVDTLTAKARIIGDDVVVEDFTLTQSTGSLTATGKYSISTRAYTADVRGQGLQWQGALARLGNARATFSLRFSGSGTIDHPLGTGVVDFDLAGGLAGALIGHGTANVRLDGTTALVTASIPTLGASVDAKIATSKPFVYDAIVAANKVDLEQVIRLVGLREGYVVGTASLNATASGTLSDVGNSSVFVNLQDLAASVEDVPVKLAAPSRLTWDSTGLTVDALDLGIGQKGRLHATGRLASGDVANARFDSTFSGELGDLVRIGRPFGVPPELQASGPLNLAWQSTGGLERSTGTLQLAGGSVTWGTFPTVDNLSVDAAFDGATLEVKRLTGTWQGGGIEGTASVPRAVLEESAGVKAGPAIAASAAQGFAKLRIVGLSEEAFRPWLTRSTMSNIGARITATLDTSIRRASLEGVSGRLTFDEANFIFSGVPVTQVRPLAFTIDGGVVTAQDVVFSFGGSAAAAKAAAPAVMPGAPTPSAPGGGELTLTGTARLAPADKAALDLAVRGGADLRILSAFAPTVAVDGNAKVNAGIGGSPSSPVFSGRVDVADAEVLIREPRIVLGDLTGTVAFDGRRVLLDSFTGTANGGALVLDGGFLLSGARAVGGALTVQMQGAALEYPNGLQSESDALLTLRPEATGWTLSGDVIVARSVFNEPISIAAIAAARRTRPPAPLGQDRAIERLHLNVSVTTRDNLRVDNNYARLEAFAAVRVLGNAQEPVIAGRVTLQEGGEVYLAGRTFHITRGNISFTSPTRIEPEFDVALQTRVGGTDISLTLDGPMDRLQTDVRSSDPDIDSREAMAMIFGNFRGEDAVTLLSAELLGATGRAVGLDTLRVERGFETNEFRADPGLIFAETDPSTRLTLSKRLRPDVEITLSQSLRQSGGLSAVVSYKPRRNVELRVISRDNLDRAVALRHEITFGGGQATQATRAPQPEVSAVTFSGDLAIPEDELRKLVRLGVGKRFDFYTWQRDIDKIRNEYQKHGYYEVRIRGTRQPSNDGKTLALDYHIISGPLAELVIAGHPLEPKLEEELRDSWRRTIFDRFLIEDMQSRIRRHLISENIIGSTVKAEITVSTPERKQVRVTVEAGTTVSNRRVLYMGNVTFKPGDLDRVVKEAGLDVDGWVKPSRVASAVEDFYRHQGFLEVGAKAGEPRVEGSEAVLPVTIEEGPRFTIDEIAFPGIAPERQADVAAAANLRTGNPYVTTDVDAARRRVQDFYTQRGFNTVEVDVQTMPDDASALVDVAFAVTEGPHQILREVVTEGAMRTRAGVVRRALRLQPGQPVNLGAWSQARKRVYDTNVFRQVDIEAVPLEPTPEEKAAGIQPVRALVRLTEYPVWRARYGLQVNDEKTSGDNDPIEVRQQSLGILADIRNQNLFGRALTAGIAGRIERDRRSESFFLSNSSFFGLPLRTYGFIFTSHQRFRVDNEVVSISDRSGLSAEQRWRPSRRLEVTYGYRFERNHTFDPAPPQGEVLPFDLVVNVAKLMAAALMDRRDDPFEPTRGWFSSANWDQAVTALGSDYGSERLLFQQMYFRSVGRLILATRAQVGAGFRTQALLRTERFNLGGATTVRGYGENSLGPRDAQNAVVGGNALLLLNVEARFPVRGWVQGVIFADAGNVFLTRSDLSFGDLKLGYGIGLRLASPFAMLRVDFGIPASVVTPNQPKRGRFYIGIGHIF